MSSLFQYSTVECLLPVLCDSLDMPRMSMETRTRVVFLSEAGFSVGEIKSRLAEEGVLVSKTSLCLLLRRYRERVTLKDLRWYHHSTLLSNVHLRFIDTELAGNSDLTSTQLHRLLQEKFPGVTFSSQEGKTFVGVGLR